MNPKAKRNVFLYWTGRDYKLISILRNLIYLHSTNGRGYNVILITPKNVKKYINNIPKYFYKLCPAHQADFVRVNVICDYGGIWLDSDSIVLDSLDSLFDIIDQNEGFLIKENNHILSNGIFGSKKNTTFMRKWKNEMIIKLHNTQGNIGWVDIGSEMLQNMYYLTPKLFDKYKIFEGLDNLYPVNWSDCVTEFINKPYDNYKTIIRDYQPLVVLVNSVYKALECKTINEILDGNMPINYFINKSFKNTKLIDYNFIEIGTSNFDTLIEKADNNTKGISVDAVKYYVDKLPEKLNVKKIIMGISNKNAILDVYYIPENVIEENNLPHWFKGCNCIGGFRPLHIKYNMKNLCVKEQVEVIACHQLFYKNKVRNVKYLKIDTEDHDCIILQSLYNYISYLPSIYFPQKIQFESNENCKSEDVDKIVRLFTSLGYKLKSKGYNTILVF
jgi:hypothetical protein